MNRIQHDSRPRNHSEEPAQELPEEPAIIRGSPGQRRNRPTQADEPTTLAPEDEPAPKSSRRRKSDDAPPALSTFAVRYDGVLLLSLEDAGDRDLTGREIQHFLVLTYEETAAARETADDGISAAVALAIGRLPKKNST